ncbi:HAD family hydrolase [Rhizobium sp. SEMIA 4085]|uniref:HAD superfamily hydrolase protein n=1 Tax=Rhizobium gallicum bv. gallicum R602sp TaxID=1041138 RepID=A0A0B4X8G9_9HYPH|nr:MULTISPECIES: HAD family hydrolase [Rhizobium]AJD42898.1 HAD superfamily hydrolase protein [Rhizobium gallicum bv. gallicum R602sp]NNH28024.1 HAD family hydrolase [Rhizobium sp. SEMIA 4085]TDW35518.1 HAD superfamily hydrolase (TIGR01509 family) [Rhizobium azibense]
MANSETRLVIFDCDGVLVDSEPISVSVLVEAMNDLGVPITEEEVYGRFLGKSLATVIETMKSEYQVHAGDEFLERIRTNLYSRFRKELRPIEGIGATIDALDIPCCVASSSQVERIRLSLTVTGLIDKLPNIFSASMVKNGKPAPDLFLHAAREMQVDPEDCLVIEDSPAGIEAAQAAGMTVFAFTGGSHANFAGYRAELERLSPERVFDAMPDLIHLIQKQKLDGACP